MTPLFSLFSCLGIPLGTTLEFVMIVILAAVYLLILAFAYKVSGGTDGRMAEALELSGLLSLVFCGVLVAVVAFLRVVVFNNPV
jgi:hypothetical protein